MKALSAWFYPVAPFRVFGMLFNGFLLYFTDNIYFFSDLFMIFGNNDGFVKSPICGLKDS